MNDQNTADATYPCKQNGHNWSYHHNPESIPVDYRQCFTCNAIDCSEAVKRAEIEARIDAYRAMYEFIESDLKHFRDDEGQNGGLNSEMTGHGAMDFVFHAREYLTERLNQLSRGEEEKK